MRNQKYPTRRITGEELCERHSEDDNLLEKHKKRTVKTSAQIQALGKFYNEYKYPSESMKIQLAESIGLTESQISGWFCHRRLKDKRLMDTEICAFGRQDLSSGVIRDPGSGHWQDSCGSSKRGDDGNVNARLVESGKWTLQEFSAAELLLHQHGSHRTGNYNHTDDVSSRSSSSLLNMSNNHNEDPFNAAASRCRIPNFPMHVKGFINRSAPSGYLKLKGQVENACITAVKRQLGKHYSEDGPRLGVEFDLLPPGAFVSSMQEPSDETRSAGETVLPASPDVSKLCQYPKFGNGFAFNSSMASHNPKMDGTSSKTTRAFDIPGNYSYQKFRVNTALSNSDACYFGKGVDDMRIGSFSSHCNLQLYSGKVRGNCAESWSNNVSREDVSTNISQGEKIENKPSNLTREDNAYQNSWDECLSRQTVKDDRIYTERKIINENRAPKRIRDYFPQQQQLIKVVDTTNHGLIKS